MVFGINVIYLLILVAVSLGLIFGMRAMQKSVLAELSRTLYIENDPVRYARMLNGRFLFLILRRSTIAIMRLEGAQFSGSADAVWEACSILDGIKLRKEERLNWYQKALSFAVIQMDRQHAKDYLTRINRFLEKEPDKALQAVNAEASRLYGIYIDRDTGLIAELEKEAAVYSGAKLGIVLYRLAKLHHFAGDDAKAADCLKRAYKNLENNPWQDVAGRAMRDLAVLEVE
jgi:tetratricopeptide (TPR) repeat protein